MRRANTSSRGCRTSLIAGERGGKVGFMHSAAFRIGCIKGHGSPNDISGKLKMNRLSTKMGRDLGIIVRSCIYFQQPFLDECYLQPTQPIQQRCQPANPYQRPHRRTLPVFLSSTLPISPLLPVIPPPRLRSAPPPLPARIRSQRVIVVPVESGNRIRLAKRWLWAHCIGVCLHVRWERVASVWHTGRRWGPRWGGRVRVLLPVWRGRLLRRGVQ